MKVTITCILTGILILLSIYLWSLIIVKDAKPLSIYQAQEMVHDRFYSVKKADHYKDSNKPRHSQLTNSLEEPYIDQSEIDVLEKINASRKENGRGALISHPQLCRAADIRSKELYDGNYFQHTRPNGDLWNTVLGQDIDIDYVFAGENIAVMHLPMYNINEPFTASQWYDLWEGSPNHYNTMMDNEYTHIGVSIYHGVRDKEYYSYAVTIFAKF